MATFNHFLKQTGEYGQITKINLPIITVVGLPGARLYEVVLFENGGSGYVFSINQDDIEVVILETEDYLIGQRVVRTNSVCTVPTDKSYLGTVIDPQGNLIEGTASINKKAENRPIEYPGKIMMERADINSPFFTGIMTIDLFIPLGKGQKELIIGDRKTGKTSALLTIAKNHVVNNGIVVYCFIAKKQNDIRANLDFFAKHHMQKKMVTIVTSPFDPQGTIFIAPYAAMSIAEYFRDAGHNVLIIFDDLSTHAKYYREISLLSQRFPGRESYPGDIFHIHAKLLERAGNFKTGSITAFPIVETYESDLGSYIATNIMSMTDGHIFFDTANFAKGRRPAINIPLSVTRVGRQSQSSLKRNIGTTLTAFLSRYEDLIKLSHFGAELSPDVKLTLDKGKALFELLVQSNFMIIPEEMQIILIGLLWSTNQNFETVIKKRAEMILKVDDKKYLGQLKAVIGDAKTLEELVKNISTGKI